MKLKTAVYYAAMFLQLDAVCTALESASTSYTGATKAEIDRLVRCANLVIGETASDYLPLKTRETVTTDDGEIEYSKLTKSIIDVYSVKDEYGRTVPVREYFDRILVPKKGRYEVEYSYMPQSVGLDDEIPYTERLGARAIGYGTACEYCIISGMTDDAVLWDKRYKDALHLAETGKTDKRVKPRRWA